MYLLPFHAHTVWVPERPQKEGVQGHSRKEVHNARSIGGHTHETTVDAGVVDDSHPAHGSRVTAAGVAGGRACDCHMTAMYSL